MPISGRVRKRHRRRSDLRQRVLIRPSFIFVIFASGSCGCVQSSFEPFFFRFRSIRAKFARVGVSMPTPARALSRNPDSFPRTRAARFGDSVVRGIDRVDPQFVVSHTGGGPIR